MSTSTARTRGAHHIGLTVPDLDAARHFFVDALAFTEVGARPEYPAVFVSDGHTLITLWQAEHPASATAFDRRRNIGLHHLALAVQDLAALEQLHGELAARDDVRIEFAPEGLGTLPAKHFMCRIPGDIRLELVAATG